MTVAARVFSRYLSTAGLAAYLLCAAPPKPTSSALLPQDFDQAASAQDYVRFLVLEIDQWAKDFPHRFYMAAAQPPVDASKLSEQVKAGADQLGNSIKQLSAASKAKDVLTNPGFRGQLDKTLAAAKQVNEAFGSQRFPRALRTDWDQIRTNLNSLAQIYKVETLAYLAPPEPGSRKMAASKPVPGGGFTGYIVDQSCALKGKGMWINATCVAKCIRDGDKVVLVTEEGKVYQIANLDKVDSDFYGQKVTVGGKAVKDTITVASLQ